MKIILMAAVTIDGKIARNAHHFVDWASREDRRLFVKTTQQAGVIIMGHNTYETLPAPLKNRLHIVMTRSPGSVFRVADEVEFTDMQPDELLEMLEQRGYSEAVLIGGAQVNSLFLRSRKIDEIWLTIEPYLFGEGLGLFEGALPDVQPRLIHVEQLNESGTILLKYSLDWELILE